MSLRSFESAYNQEIELAHHEIELYARKPQDETFPPLLPFSIQLLQDTPQSLRSPHSLLAHTLTATLHPADRHAAPMTKSLVVHTRRYTARTHSIPQAPETHSFEDPTRVEVQLPRDTFTSAEVIPLYITVPPPTREVVIDRGLRLRNIRAELVRVIKVKREHYGDSDSDSDDYFDDVDDDLDGGTILHSYDPDDPSTPSKSKALPQSPLFLGSSYPTVVARSGASCRFHLSRSIQLRFLLHQNPAGSPSDSRTTIDRLDNDIDSALITQTTLLHTVSFHIKLLVSFVDTSNQTERISTIIIPVTILPPPAPLPQISQAIDDAYQKKHDRPPTRTVREEETDPSIPHYSEGEAGPSMLSPGAPPPFEERDAPPPFFASAHEASTSSYLPTFQESEREVIFPDTGDMMHDLPVALAIPGEGTLFGFHVSQQFDGHSEDMQQSFTPPPSMDMPSHHTELVVLSDHETIGLVLDSEEVNGLPEQPPPPPPAMDDPSDPPPSIDSDFRMPIPAVDGAGVAAGATINYGPPDAYPTSVPLPTDNVAPVPDGHAPPPYLIPESHREGHQVMRPPPYVD